MEAKQFGQFIAGIRKEKKMTQAELAQQIHVTDKAVSRWERGLGFPDIQTLEPLAQALGITVLELMRSEKKETEEQDQQPEERRYTQGEVLASMTVIVWMTKLASLGGALVIGGIAATVFVSLWYFFQNIDDEESRKIYGVAAILSVGFLLALAQYVWGDRLSEILPGGIDTQQEIFWTVWYLLVIVMFLVGTLRVIRKQRQKKEKRYKTVMFSVVRHSGSIRVRSRDKKETAVCGVVHSSMRKLC